MSATTEHHISRNVFASIIQVVVSGVVFFILYRYLYDRLGVEQIGVWSLVIATTAVSRIGDLGLSAAVVRFVAQAYAAQDLKRGSEIVQTIGLTLAVTMAVVLIIVYPLASLILPYFLPQESLPLALMVLPYAMISLWVMVLVSVLSGGLDGCMRMDKRSFAMALSHMLYLTLAVSMVPHYGLVGVAIAQLTQSVILMVALWWMLRRTMEGLPVIPYKWSFSTLKEVFGYGVSFQIISIMNMLFDPIIKALMSKLGGLESLGFYEMANRLILQGRAMIVEASRVMVPAVAALQERDAKRVNKIFLNAYQATFFVSVAFYGVVGILLPMVSMLWLGHYQATFVVFAMVLNLGWFVNTLVGPAYFSNLGSGNLKANMISHVLMLTFGAGIGFFAGSKHGGIGVVVGMTVGLATGSIYLLAAYIKSAGLNVWNFLLPRSLINLFLISIASVITAYGLIGHNTSMLVDLILSMCLSGLMVLFVIHHPLLQQLMSSILQRK